MAIISPADLPVVLKLNSDPIKKYVLTKLGHPHTEVEISEDQFETILRTSGDFIAGYFPKEQRMAVFYTQPLKPTYPLPADAYWIQEIAWHPATTQIGDIFGAESYLFNVGNVTGLMNIMVDYHLLQAYRKFTSKMLATEGHWECINEVNGDATKQVIRLYPTPKGTFPVVVLYYPVVSYFRSPTAKKLTMDMALAESKVVVGSSRRKISGIPTPDGGSLSLDGESLVSEGNKEISEIIQQAIYLGEPAHIYVW